MNTNLPDECNSIISQYIGPSDNIKKYYNEYVLEELIEKTTIYDPYISLENLAFTINFLLMNGPTSDYLYKYYINNGRF